MSDKPTKRIIIPTYIDKSGNSDIRLTNGWEKKYLNNFKFTPAILRAGDILFFDWYCAHKSIKNYSNKSRMIFYATYCAKNNKIRDIRKKYYYDKKFSKNNKLIKSLQFN